MTEELSHENLSHLIEHWIEHNETHIENFKEWAQKAKIDGFLEASENMLDAANKIKEANEYLQKAKAGLFR
jgi:inorganic pyrophosphatase